MVSNLAMGTMFAILASLVVCDTGLCHMAQEVDKNTHVSHLALVQMDCVYPILNPCSFIWTDFKRQFLLCVRIVGKYDDPSILILKKFNVLFQSQNLIQNGVIKDSSYFFIFTFDTKQEGEGLIIFLLMFDTFIKISHFSTKFSHNNDISPHFLYIESLCKKKQNLQLLFCFRYIVFR